MELKEFKRNALFTPVKSTKKEKEMNVLWVVNTNTFLLILLIIMVSYLTAQVSLLIRWLKRE
jgi:hypothetical protein